MAEVTESQYKYLVSRINELTSRIEVLETEKGPPRDHIPASRLIEPRKTAPVSSHVVDLNDTENKFNDMMWMMVETIGKEGFARYPDIAQHISGQVPEFVDNRLRRAANSLVGMNVLKRTDLNLTLVPNMILYCLSDIGERLFRKRFNIAPVESEIVRVIKEHDNLEHGYGILELGQLLANSGKYKSVHVYNRVNAVKFKDGTQYIPDIICLQNDNRFSVFYEYERGTHTQKDFNAKCDKMCRVTRTMNFVAPNRKIMIKRLLPQIEAWIRTRGRESIVRQIIRLTTSKELQTCSLSDESWLIVFDMSKSDKPESKVKLD